MLILEELYGNILGTYYSRLMGPIVLMLTEDAKEDNVDLKYDEIDNFLTEEYMSLLNQGLIAEEIIPNRDPDEMESVGNRNILITLKGREVYEQYISES